MPDRGAPPDGVTQGHTLLDLDVEFVDRLPGDRPFILLASTATTVCLAVRAQFTPEIRAQAARDIDSLVSLGLWPRRAATAPEP
jgi:hypothetical protein